MILKRWVKMKNTVPTKNTHRSNEIIRIGKYNDDKLSILYSIESVFNNSL